MESLRPPKRRIPPNAIPLDDTENRRFLSFVRTKGLDQLVNCFISETGLYLRGRWDGTARTGTEPCGYVFISKQSFDKGHAPLLFFDPMPNDSPLYISFRKWKHVIPFSKEAWDGIDGDDRLQKKMRIIELNSEKKLQRAIELAKVGRQTFERLFDLTIDLV